MGDCSVTGRDTEVKATLTRQSNKIDVLSDRVGILMDRLASVRTPKPVEAEVACPDAPKMCILAEDIKARTDSIVNITGLIDVLITEIEL